MPQNISNKKILGFKIIFFVLRDQTKGQSCCALYIWCKNLKNYKFIYH